MNSAALFSPFIATEIKTRKKSSEKNKQRASLSPTDLHTSFDKYF